MPSQFSITHNTIFDLVFLFFTNLFNGRQAVNISGINTNDNNNTRAAIPINKIL